MKSLRTFVVFVALLLCATNNLHSQTWQYTGALSEAKRTGTLTTLPDQTAIYVGGTNSSGVALSSCEIWDPSTGSWTATGSMAVARERHTTTLLSDGRLVVIGGNTASTNDNIVTSLIEIYDYKTKTWSNAGKLSVGRQNHTSTLLQNGTILVTGGYTGTDLTSSCEIFDPSTGLCKTVAPLIVARHDHSATLMVDGKVLVVGGRTGSYLTECEIYDPSSDTWTATGDMHQARIKGSLVAFHDGTILASAGRNSSSSSAPGSEVFLSPFNTWTSTTPMYQPVTWHSSTLLTGDRFLVTGGLTDANWSSDFSAVTTPTCEWYDKTSMRWFYAPELNQKRCYHDACYIHQTSNSALPKDLVLVASGLIGTDQFTNTAEILDVTLPALEQYMAMKKNLASVSLNSTSLHASVLMDNPSEPLLQLTSVAEGNLNYEIMAANGKSISRENLMVSNGESLIPLNASNLPSGMYFVSIHLNDQNLTLKFLVLR